MNSINFVSYQFFITVIRGGFSLLLLYFFSSYYNEKELSIIVALWSLGNMSSVFLFMSSMTIAPQVFFSNTNFKKNELEKASYFQLFRLFLCILLTVVLSLVIIEYYKKFIFFIPFIIFNNLASILPIWKYYSNRMINKVFYSELLFKAPIILSIITILFCNSQHNIYYIFLILSSLQLLYVVYDIIKNINCKSYNHKYVVFTLSYFHSIYKINIATMLFNTGQVYFISLLAPINIINQIALADKIKNLYLQLIGIFISNRISKNRNLIKRTDGLRYIHYIQSNLSSILFILILFIVFIILYFLNFYSIIMKIQLNNFLIFVIPMIYILLTGISIIMISHVLNSYGKVNEFSRLYTYTAIGALAIAVLSIYSLSYYAILLSGILHSLLVIFFGIFVLKKHKII